MPPIASALLLLLLLSPVVNPWYALWALGPAIAARQPLVAALGCVVVLAYLNGSVLPQAAGWVFKGSAAPFAVAWPITLVQLAVLALVALWVHRSPSTQACAR